MLFSRCSGHAALGSASCGLCTGCPCPDSSLQLHCQGPAQWHPFRKALLDLPQPQPSTPLLALAHP